MLKQFEETTSRGCIFLFFQISALLADIITIFGWLNGLGSAARDPSIPVFHWSENSWLSGFILFYGLTGLSTLIWVGVAEKIIGLFRAHLYALVLYLIPSIFIIYSYADTFYYGQVVRFFMSGPTIGLFFFLPILTGRVIMEIYMTPVWSPRINW